MHWSNDCSYQQLELHALCKLTRVLFWQISMLCFHTACWMGLPPQLALELPLERTMEGVAHRRRGRG